MTRTCLLLLAVLAAGCQQKMAVQPGYRREQASDFFPDGASVRPLPDGAVAREWDLNDALESGLKVPAGGHPAGTTVPASDAPDDPGKFAAAAPFPLTRADLARGQERYTIYCAVCHGPVGDGDGKIVERGYVKPPSYHEDASRGFARYGKAVPLRAAPIGYLFAVVTRGYGAMPQYARQIPAADRWRIAAYVQALQLSQHADAATLPPADRAALGALP